MRIVNGISLCALVLFGLLPPLAGAFEIPRGAWERAIGDVPKKCESSCPNRGVALGGFGAGSFMYNITGTFGPWADEVGEYRRTWLIGAAFHVYEKKGDSTTAKCLATEPSIVPEVWQRLRVGDGTY